MEKRTLVNGFKKQFGDVEADEVYFAPGRVNLIGEHIDYNGGYVLPCAIQLGTYAVVRQRDDERVRLYSENFSHMGILEASLSQIAFSDALDWAWGMRFPRALICTFMEICQTVQVCHHQHPLRYSQQQSSIRYTT